MKKYVCDVCGWEYDPAEGLPEQGIAPGTPFEELPEDFECPMCSVGKDQFSPIDWQKARHAGTTCMTSYSIPPSGSGRRDALLMRLFRGS